MEQILLRNQAGLDEDVVVFAVVAEEAEEVRAQLAGIVGVCWGGVAKAGVLRLEGGANPGRKCGFLFGR